MRHYNKHMECIEETSNFNFYFSNDIKNSLHMEYNFVRQLLILIFISVMTLRIAYTWSIILSDNLIVVTKKEKTPTLFLFSLTANNEINRST